MPKPDREIIAKLDILLDGIDNDEQTTESEQSTFQSSNAVSVRSQAKDETGDRSALTPSMSALLIDCELTIIKLTDLSSRLEEMKTKAITGVSDEAQQLYRDVQAIIKSAQDCVSNLNQTATIITTTAGCHLQDDTKTREIFAESLKKLKWLFYQCEDILFEGKFIIQELLEVEKRNSSRLE